MTPLTPEQLERVDALRNLDKVTLAVKLVRAQDALSVRPEAGVGLRRWHETRMRALEEAAALCDKEATYSDQDDYGAGRVRGAEACAEAIRALKDKHSPQRKSP